MLLQMVISGVSTQWCVYSALIVQIRSGRDCGHVARVCNNCNGYKENTLLLGLGRDFHREFPYNSHTPSPQM